ncbi:MAG: hypothetical protein ACR2GF_02010, partial [Acidimicrobiales bacterium]
GRFELAGHDQDSKRPLTADEDQGGKEVRELLLRAEQAARTILHDNADDLQLIGDELAERETLTSAELGELVHRPVDAEESHIGFEAG